MWLQEAGECQYYPRELWSRGEAEGGVGRVLGENVVEIEKMREAKKPGSRSAAHDWASRQCVVYLPLSLGDKLTDSDANSGLW